MPSVRTQIYLTHEQRDRLYRRAERSHQTLAAEIRSAIDAYLGPERVDLDAAASQTFGAVPDFDVPSRRGEWEQREKRIRGG